MNELDQFLKQHEDATNSHNFDNVAPLVAPDAVYWFSDGSFEGIDAIRKAFEDTWARVRNEDYRIVNVRWIGVTDELAACVYDFQWSGVIDGKASSGGGRGTNVIVKQNGSWQIVHEHLSRGLL